MDNKIRGFWLFPDGSCVDIFDMETHMTVLKRNQHRFDKKFYDGKSVEMDLFRYVIKGGAIKATISGDVVGIDGEIENIRYNLNYIYDKLIKLGIRTVLHTKIKSKNLADFCLKLGL